jgi:hypothetical protein
MKEFIRIWKQASFGWIPKKYYFDLKIVAFFAMYAIVLQYQNPTRIFFVMFKLVGFTLLWNLFKKWFAERLTMKEFLSRMKLNKNYAGIDSISPLAAELDKWNDKVKVDFPHPEINPFEETLTPLEKKEMKK